VKSGIIFSVCKRRIFLMSKSIREKIQLAKDCEYFIKRKLEPDSTEIDPEIEKRIDPEKNGTQTIFQIDNNC